MRCWRALTNCTAVVCLEPATVAPPTHQRCRNSAARASYELRRAADESASRHTQIPPRVLLTSSNSLPPRSQAPPARMADRVLGVALLVASTLGFVYYSVWVLALPFVDAEQPLHALFPPRHWAVALPAYAIVVRCGLRATQRRAAQTAAALALRSAQGAAADTRSPGAHARPQVLLSLIAAFLAKVMLLDGRKKKQARTFAQSTPLPLLACAKLALSQLTRERRGVRAHADIARCCEMAPGRERVGGGLQRALCAACCRTRGRPVRRSCHSARWTRTRSAAPLRRCAAWLSAAEGDAAATRRA